MCMLLHVAFRVSRLLEVIHDDNELYCDLSRRDECSAALHKSSLHISCHNGEVVIKN